MSQICHLPDPWPLTRVADHLAHLYEDAVHAGRHAAPAPGHAPGLRLPEQGVGDGHAVAERGVVIVLRFLPSSSPVFQVKTSSIDVNVKYTCTRFAFHIPSQLEQGGQ